MRLQQHPFAVEFMRNVTDPSWRWGNDLLEPNDLIAAAEMMLLPAYAGCGASSDWCGLPYFANLERAMVQLRATEAEWTSLRRIEDLCREALLRNFKVLSVLPASTHIDDLTVIAENFAIARAIQERYVRDLESDLEVLRTRPANPLNLLRRWLTSLRIVINQVPVAAANEDIPTDLLATAIADCVNLMRNTRASDRRLNGAASIEALAKFCRDTFGLHIPARMAA